MICITDAVVPISLELLYILAVDLQLPMQSMPNITDVVSLNPTHGEVYSIQHYVIEFARYSVFLHQ
jgi:hypothetical protein